MDIDTMVENHFKKNRDISGFESIAQLIEEVMDTMEALGTDPKLLYEADKPAGPTGAQERERVLRLPNVMPTEITVGQKPGSEDRKMFELWMGNLGISGGGGDASAVKQKLTAITQFFANPEANLKDASIPKTLSYLMFLNQFVWMLQEFNASVAGFLWEPFLAALFGGKSRQVPTSEGDIADIQIDMGGGEMAPVSLKILNEVGIVKGSFTDLVGHFAKGGTEMRYVIVVKEKGGEDVAGVKFFEFNITADSFFQWIGGSAYEQEAEMKRVEFTLASAGKQDFLKLGGSKVDAEGPTGEGPWIWIRTAKSSRGKAVPAWVRIGKIDPKTKLAKLDPTLPKRTEKGGIDVDLQGVPENGVVDPAKTPLSANIAVYKEGGDGAAQVQAQYKEKPGQAGPDTDKLWGGSEALGKWGALASKLGDPAKFFQAVQGKMKGVNAAPGYGKEQFHISPTHYTQLAEDIGGLEISAEATKEFFKLAAARINEDLRVMFNSLADLTDNIGRFFLADCGGNQCSEEDAANRTERGNQAMADAKLLEDAVAKSVGQLQEK